MKTQHQKRLTAKNGEHINDHLNYAEELVRSLSNVLRNIQKETRRSINEDTVAWAISTESEMAQLVLKKEISKFISGARKEVRSIRKRKT